jgi:hypothetical protein
MNRLSNRSSGRSVTRFAAKAQKLDIGNMEPESIEKRLETIREWGLELEGPFPYDDCRFLINEFEQITTDLMPDLDLWRSDIAGVASWGKKLMKLPPDKLRKFRDVISLKFVEEHPQYNTIFLFGLNSKHTPELAEEMDNYERIRSALCEAIDDMLKSYA